MNSVELIKNEFKGIFTNPVIVLTLFAGVVFYSFLYPLPYSHQTPREQEIVVVNQDKSLTSMQLERMVDATPQVKITHRSHTLKEAKQLFLNGEAKGILFIPKHFYRDLLLGKSPTLAFAGDSAYFLVYGTVVEGLAKASGTLAAKAKVSKLLMQGSPLSAARQQFSASSVNLKPTFNPAIGYVDYVVPAVFVLILQQTLIMGVGLMGGTQKYGLGYWSKVPHLKLLLVRSLIFVFIYYFLSMYYFGFSFDYYHISRLADPETLLLLLLPFLLTSSFIGSLLGTLLPRRELVTFVVLISSMPLIFSAGFIWPLESVPAPLIALSNLFPSTPAIQSFVKVNQMGADLSQVINQYGLMWIQSVGWGLMAYIADRKLRKVQS